VKKVHYAVILQSQLGPRSGEIFLQEDRGVVSGHFALLGVRNGFSGSVLETGKYLLSGSLRTRAIQEPYDAILTVEEGRLYGGLITRHGCWEVTGVLSGESGHPAGSEP
jgi:hypothetical protein